MAQSPFKMPGRGKHFSHKELQRLADVVEKHDRITLGSGRGTRSTSGTGLGFEQSDAGEAWSNTDYAPFWAKITDKNGPAYTTVGALGISDAATTLPVVSFADFPDTADELYFILVEAEYMEVTAGQGTNSWTVVRGVFGTTKAAHAAGAPVSWTPAHYSWTEQEQEAPGHFVDKGEPRVGTRTEGPGFEVDNNSNVPIGAHVLMILGDTGEYYLFAYCCGGGAVIWNVVAVTIAAGTYNDYALTSTTATLLVTATGNVTITGFAGGLPGRVVKVESAKASAGTITLPHESGSSTASNRMYSPTSWDEVLNPGESRLLEYDTGSNRWLVAARVAGVAVSAGIPIAASVSGFLAVDNTATSPTCGALYVYFGSAWHHTAGGGLVTVTASRTFLASDYSQMVNLVVGDGAVKVFTIPTVTPLDSCWHTVLYNNAGGASPASLRMLYEAGSTYGYIFHGGGGYIQSDGTGVMDGWGVEQYRSVKTISAATYTILPDDENKLLVFTNANGCAVAVPQSTATGNFPGAFRVHLHNASAGSAASPYGAVTVTPATSTVDGNTTATIFPRCSIELVADGTNYRTERGRPPGGIVTWSGASIALTPAHHGKLLVYTGSAQTDVTGDGTTTRLGFRVGIRNAGSSNAALIRFARSGGGYDWITQGQAYDLYVPDDGDSGTTNYAMTGITSFGHTSKSADYTLLRGDKGRVVEFTGAADRALTGFTADSDDATFAFAIKNNCDTGKLVTFTPGGGQLVNGAANLVLRSCEGVWVFTDGAKWTAVTGKVCSPLTTKGDIWTYSTTEARLPVGSNGQYLRADSTQTTGLVWDTLDAADIPNLPATIITSGTMASARLGSGSADSTTTLRGDGTWVGGGGSAADVSGTSTDALVTILEMGGSLVTATIKNTGGANSLYYEIPVTDHFGNTGTLSGNIAPGAYVTFGTFSSLVAGTYVPYSGAPVKVKDTVAASHTTYTLAYQKS